MIQPQALSFRPVPGMDFDRQFFPEHCFNTRIVHDSATVQQEFTDDGGRFVGSVKKATGNRPTHVGGIIGRGGFDLDLFGLTVDLDENRGIWTWGSDFLHMIERCEPLQILGSQQHS